MKECMHLTGKRHNGKLSDVIDIVAQESLSRLAYRYHQIFSASNCEYMSLWS